MPRRLLSRRSDNGLPGLDSRRCFVYELLLTREKFYEEADYVWRRTGTGPQSSGHGCVRDITDGYRKEPFKSLIKEVEEKRGTYTRYTVENKLLYYRTDEYEQWRLCLPEIEYRNQIIHDNHDLAIAGHPGFIQTYNKIARSYYWPRMN